MALYNNRNTPITRHPLIYHWEWVCSVWPNRMAKQVNKGPQDFPAQDWTKITYSSILLLPAPASSGSWFSLSNLGSFGVFMKNLVISACHSGVGLGQYGLPPACLFAFAVVRKMREQKICRRTNAGEQMQRTNAENKCRKWLICSVIYSMAESLAR